MDTYKISGMPFSKEKSGPVTYPQDAPNRQEPDSKILLHILVFVNGCFSPLEPNVKSNLLEFAFMALSIWGGGGGGGCEEDDDEDEEEP